MKTKRMLIIGAAVALAAGLVFFFAREVDMKMPLTRYEGEGFSFQYPKEWTLRESVGSTEKYLQVHLFGAIDKDVGFGPSVTLTVYPKKAGGGAHDSARDLAVARAARAENLPGYKLQEKKVKRLPCGATALEYRAVCVYRLPLYHPEAKDVPIREHLLFFEEGESLYVLIYKNLVSEYWAAAPVFDRIIKTLRFKAR